MFQSIFGSVDSLTTELITEITSNSSYEENVNTLNEDNFPLTKKDYYNGQLEKKFNFTYE
jgi:hypothetical protein